MPSVPLQLLALAGLSALAALVLAAAWWSRRDAFARAVSGAGAAGNAFLSAASFVAFGTAPPNPTTSPALAVVTATAALGAVALGTWAFRRA